MKSKIGKATIHSIRWSTVQSPMDCLGKLSIIVNVQFSKEKNADKSCLMDSQW